MKDGKQWISFIVYLMIWIFSFTLFDIYLKKYNYSENQIIKLCVGGLVIMCFIYNSDYIKY